MTNPRTPPRPGLRALFTRLAAPAGVLAGLVSCGSGGGGGPSSICAEHGRCGPSDGLTDMMVAACERDLADPACGPSYQAYVECFVRDDACLPDAGGRDEIATSAACAPENAAWAACLSGAADAGAGDAGDAGD